MSITVRPGIYLEDNPPARSQYRVGRRSKLRPVIVVHTAESGTDPVGPDPKAENVAKFIRNRSTAGSYHSVGDADSIIDLVRFDNEAFQDGTGSNRWAIGISLAMNADDWPHLTPERRSQLTDTAVLMAVRAARHLAVRGLPMPAPKLLTKAESERADASGFISHARRDPSRRSDPGAGFPWAEFFTRYAQATTQETTHMPNPLEADTLELQRILAAWGANLGTTGPNHDGVDGVPGPVTLAAAVTVLRHQANTIDELAAAVAEAKAAVRAPVDPAVAEKARGYDSLTALLRGVLEHTGA